MFKCVIFTLSSFLLLLPGYLCETPEERHDRIMQDCIRFGKEAFAQTDLNKNGILTKDEMPALIDKNINGICFWNDEQVLRLFWAMDRNVDNKVDLHEFLSFDEWVYRIINLKTQGQKIIISRLIKRGDGFMKPYFAELDTNNDGFIDEKEVASQEFIKTNKVQIEYFKHLHL